MNHSKTDSYEESIEIDLDSYEESIEIEFPSQFTGQEEGFEVDNSVGVLSHEGDDASSNAPATASLPRISKGKCFKGCIALATLLAALTVVGITTRSSKNNVVTNGTRIGTFSPTSLKPKASKAPHLSSSPNASNVPKAKTVPVRK